MAWAWKLIEIHPLCPRPQAASPPSEGPVTSWVVARVACYAILHPQGLLLLLAASSCHLPVRSHVPSSGNPSPQPELLLHLPSPLACTVPLLRGHTVLRGWPCGGPLGEGRLCFLLLGLREDSWVRDIFASSPPRRCSWSPCLLGRTGPAAGLMNTGRAAGAGQAAGIMSQAPAGRPRLLQPLPPVLENWNGEGPLSVDSGSFNCGSGPLPVPPVCWAECLPLHRSLQASC